jgi:DNA-binding NarL/FixJ family response regulator
VFATVRRLREHGQDYAILLVEGPRGSVEPRDAIAAGADGVVSRRHCGHTDRLVGAIQVVLGGGLVSAGRRSVDVARRLRRSRISRVAHGLTEREHQVLRLLADGLSNRQIADELAIAEQSAKNHVSSVLRKLAVPNRTAAAAMARREGMV